MVDAADLKSAESLVAREGSNPSSGTKSHRKSLHRAIGTISVLRAFRSLGGLPLDVGRRRPTSSRRTARHAHV